jgi:entericidin A
MKKSAMLQLVMLFMIAVGFLGLSGCNTMEGLGKDVSKLGDKIENKAEEKKSY